MRLQSVNLNALNLSRFLWMKLGGTWKPCGYSKSQILGKISQFQMTYLESKHKRRWKHNFLYNLIQIKPQMTETVNFKRSLWSIVYELKLNPNSTVFFQFFFNITWRVHGRMTTKVKHTHMIFSRSVFPMKDYYHPFRTTCCWNPKKSSVWVSQGLFPMSFTIQLSRSLTKV